MTIPFTQFMRPDGRRKTITITRSPEVNTTALSLIDDGYCFTAEVLTNGMVSLACVDPEDQRDIAIEVCMNDGQIPARVDRLVEKAERHRRGEA